MCRALGLGVVVGCAQVLGIPSDPVLVDADPISEMAHEPLGHDAGAESTENTPEPGDAAAAPVTPTGTPSDGVRADGLTPPGNVAAIDDSLSPDLAPSEPTTDPSQPQTALADAGVADGGPSCDGVLGRVPVDVAVIFDNSGSMVAEATEFENALPAFAETLEKNGVDYRLILLSRHRSDERGATEEAGTSVCVAAPLSGLATCPGTSPVLGERFFPYSIKIDAQDSFDRLVQSFTEPDRFGLAPHGWSEWLRPEARKVLIEISDSDSSVSVDTFLQALAARSGGLGADAAHPDFVFHSIVGLRPKQLALLAYDADEPIEARTCSAEGNNPDNAGETYQALSRRTGGLRLPVCPPAGLGLRLQLLATDVSLRSVRVCAAAD